MLLALLAIAGGSLWYAWHSHQSGETRFPVKQSSARRTITRAEDPALYWTSIAIYSTIGTGSILFSTWLIRHRQK
jgi:hypothetical protein